MSDVNIKIDGKEVSVPSDYTILDAARGQNINIPTLCHLKEYNESGACRICVVEVKGARNLVASCVTPVAEGMEVHTRSESVVEARQGILDLMLSNHKIECLTCKKVGQCKLQEYCGEYGVSESSFGYIPTEFEKDTSNKFYDYDPSKCIMCGKCVAVCSNQQCTNAIGLINRGYETHVGVAGGLNLDQSRCVSCGNCVSNCPTGALMSKGRENYVTWNTEKTKSTCTYCGCGCELTLLSQNNKIVGVEPSNGKANENTLCVKGKYAYNFINHEDRLTTPLIKKEGKFVSATWDEAMSLIEEKAKTIKLESGANAFAGLSSARTTNEANYLFQKMMRAGFGTNNVDHCARLCHASTVAGLANSFGSGAMTNAIDEVKLSDCILVTGSNTTETHPIIGTKIRQAVKNGTKLIVIEPRRIDLVENADLFIQIKPGTNVAMSNALMNVIISENLMNKKFIDENTENFDAIVEVVKEYTPEKVAKICGCNAVDIVKAARTYANASAASIYYAMGVTQFSTGTNGVMNLANLAMIAGQIGRPGTGVNPLRGQNNVQGACDMGSLPGDLPGYQKVFNKESREKFEAAWGVKLDDKPGLTVTEIMNAADKNDVRFLYIMGENPMVTDPDTNHVKHALGNTEFLVVQDIFLTETAELADVVLPACTFAEKDGTYTNTERRVQRIRKAIEPRGESRADWQIIAEMLNRLGVEANYSKVSEVFDEMAKLTPSYAGISYERIEKNGIQWPCPEKDHEGTRFLHANGKFLRGKGLFNPAEYSESYETADSEYPYILTTGRILYHYHSATMTNKSEGINAIAPESFIEINPEDAVKLGVSHEGKAKVASRRGEITAKVVVTERVAQGIVFMPFHFSENGANYLTNGASESLDPHAKIPELKISAVKIVRA